MKIYTWNYIIGIITILGFILVVIDFVWRERIQKYRAINEKNRQSKIKAKALLKLNKVIEIQQNDFLKLRTELQKHASMIVFSILAIGIWIITTIETIWVNSIELTDKMKHITIDDFKITIFISIVMFYFFRKYLREKELLKQVEERTSKYKEALKDELNSSEILNDYDEKHFGISLMKFGKQNDKI